MRVRVGARQLQVLRLLDTHRLLTTACIHAMAFETATRRTCEICLHRLHQEDWGCWSSPCTAELRRYGLTLRRFARIDLSGC